MICHSRTVRVSVSPCQPLNDISSIQPIRQKLGFACDSRSRNHLGNCFVILSGRLVVQKTDVIGVCMLAAADMTPIF